MLLVGFADDGVTAGASTRRGNPLPLPLTVLSTQSPIGTAGPVYGYVVSTVGFAVAVNANAARSAEAVAVFRVEAIVDSGTFGTKENDNDNAATENKKETEEKSDRTYLEYILGNNCCLLIESVVV